VKFIIFILILFVSNSVLSKRIDFIFDIDGVLVDRANKETVKHLYPPEKLELLKSAGRVLELNEHIYILNNGAEELVEYLSEIPDAKITFFSTGPRDRNEIFLNHFKLNNGKKFIDVSEGRLFSNEDALELSKLDDYSKTNYQSRINEFVGPVKKDLTLINGIDLESAILIDDRVVNAARGQEKNLLKVDLSLTREKPTAVLNYFLKEVKDKPMSYIGRHFYNWNNRLMITAGIIDQVLKVSKLEKISTRDALWRTQWEKKSGSLTYKLTNSLKPEIFIRRGEEIFYKLNNRFKSINTGIYICDYHRIFRSSY